MKIEKIYKPFTKFFSAVKIFCRASTRRIYKFTNGVLKCLNFEL